MPALIGNHTVLPFAQPCLSLSLPVNSVTLSNQIFSESWPDQIHHFSSRYDCKDPGSIKKNQKRKHQHMLKTGKNVWMLHSGCQFSHSIFYRYVLCYYRYLYRTQIYLGSETERRCWNLTDLTLADANSILTDNANRALQGNVEMQVTQSGGQLWNQCKWCYLMSKFRTNLQTLPKAQRTQGIESLTWTFFSIEFGFF